MSLADRASLLIVAAGLATAVVAALLGEWRSGLATALEFWVAGGLLRLGFNPAFDRLLSAAAIIAVRQLVSFGLVSGHQGSAAPTGPPVGSGSLNP